MVTVTQNKLVYITYSILDSRGMVVEQHDIPVGYVQGANSGILPAIESAVAGRKIGERVEIALSPEEGYGLRDESLVFVDDIENVPPEFRRVGRGSHVRERVGRDQGFLRHRRSRTASSRWTAIPRWPDRA